ncbi:hypothetical protein [Methylobacterium sp. NEAU K]|uniref:hypothetical protein n=1 Tax=Methylobacterium sp. NEAU K TaxID=3064946 RepID=UPI00273733B1|nr:hypothetical protein [Methylobacterium sp. NEAU K]MDP4005303.1 hypothetical protein [Methylobacterium sp. NEAU K]
MHSLHTELTPADHLDPARFVPGERPSAVRTEPARVIEIGEVTAGIAVPEGRGVRFFSSSRDFDGLDGTVFRNAEHAARAARERANVRARSAARQGGAVRLRRRSA